MNTTTKHPVETLSVICVGADEVKVGDHVMTPTGPKPVLKIARHSKTGRLIFSYGTYLETRFGRYNYEPVYLLEVK